MQKISYIFQIIFKIALIFLIIFIWVRYFVSSLLISILITVSLTLIIDFITRFIAKKKYNKTSLKQMEREEAENCFLSLSINKKSTDFFLKLAEKKHKAEKRKNYILINHEENVKVILFPYLTHKALSTDDIIKILSATKSISPSKIVVVCGSIEKETFSFIKNFDVEFVLLDQYETYQKLYKPYETYPEITIKYKKEKSLAFKDLIAYSLNRSRAKGYFISALFLILSTLFVKTTIYYCIVASVLVMFSLISLYNPFARNVKTKEIL